MNARTLLAPAGLAAGALGACGGGAKTTSAESSPQGDIPDNQVVLVKYLAKAAPNAVTGKAGTDALERYVQELRDL